MIFDADDDHDVAADDDDDNDDDDDKGDDDDGDVGESMLTGQNAFPGQVALQVERNLIVWRKQQTV